MVELRIIGFTVKCCKMYGVFKYKQITNKDISRSPNMTYCYILFK